jgi:hypothetical protein
MLTTQLQHAAASAAELLDSTVLLRAVLAFQRLEQQRQQDERQYKQELQQLQ